MLLKITYSLHIKITTKKFSALSLNKMDEFLEYHGDILK